MHSPQTRTTPFCGDMPVPKQVAQPFIPPLPPQSAHLLLVLPLTSRQAHASGFGEALISVILRVVSMMVSPASPYEVVADEQNKT